MAKPQYQRRHQQARAALLEADPWCAHCGAPATVADHQPPITLHDHDVQACWCTLVPSCASCSSKQGAALRNARRPVQAPKVPSERDGFPIDDPIWDVAWLADLREPPPEACWPRLMTPPHPRAVGSLGELVEASAELRSGRRLRWWQRLAVRRLLEVDNDGHLVWFEVLLSVSRQGGKSWLLRELMWWRMHQAERFGEPQEILHVARTVGAALDVAAPAMRFARDDIDTYKVKHTMAREEISKLDDLSRWLIRSEEAAYGHSASLTIVDEAWDVQPKTVAEGIEPTMLERTDPQLILVSTAHRAARDLFPRRRAQALTEFDNPANTLLIEWSAAPGHDPGDPASWRAASPSWSPQRARLIGQAWSHAAIAEPRPGESDPVREFVAQHCNSWAVSRQPVAVSKGEPLVDVETWRAATTGDISSPVSVVAIEDNHGNGAAVGWAAEHAGGIVCGGRLVVDREEAVHVAHGLTEGGLTLLGASIANDPLFGGMWFETIGNRETPQALSLFRARVAAGQLHHVDSPDLDAQLADVRVVDAAGGLTVARGHRSDLVRATAWAVSVVERNRMIDCGIS